MTDGESSVAGITPGRTPAMVRVYRGDAGAVAREYQRDAAIWIERGYIPDSQTYIVGSRPTAATLAIGAGLWLVLMGIVFMLALALVGAIFIIAGALAKKPGSLTVTYHRNS